jgi:hypothetical protein
MWRNMMRSTKSQKALVLYYSIDMRMFTEIERYNLDTYYD